MTETNTNDLFVGKKGRLSRNLIRGRSSSLRWTSSSYDEVKEQAAAERERQETEIRVTMASGALETVLQPIIDLHDGQTVGVEALSRFNTTPRRSPHLWFADAAAVGLGLELEMTSLRLALEELRRLPSEVYLSFNASAATIVSDQFKTALADVPGERFVVELTQDTKDPDYKALAKAVKRMRSTGIRLAVDDIGATATAGADNFRHILDLEPDIIKLDIGMTRGTDADNGKQALGSALLKFGMDFATFVAEGIETEEEFETMRSLGCRYGQGYYLGRPGKMRTQAPRHGGAGQLWIDQEESVTSDATAPSGTDASDKDDSSSTLGTTEAGAGGDATGDDGVQAAGDDGGDATGDGARQAGRDADRDAERDSAAAGVDDYAELLAVVAELQAQRKGSNTGRTDKLIIRTGVKAMAEAVVTPSDK